ncbi:MAG: hypothetical protein KDD70_13455 [Bdellovibrionales bacterium]|nr:hypothetical protein [Bdellovibrionales bacterium]
MSGLGSSPEEILRRGLSLVDQQLSRSKSEPVGVLTETEVVSLNKATFADVAEHMRLFGMKSVKLVGLGDLNEIQLNSRENRFYLGNSLICEVECAGTTLEYYIFRNEVSKKIYEEFILQTKRLIKRRERTRKPFELDLVKIAEYIAGERERIESESLKKVDQFLDDAVGEIVGYVRTISEPGHHRELVVPMEEEAVAVRKAIRAGAPVLYDSELRKLVERTKHSTKEDHLLGTQLICSKVTEKGERLGQGRQYFIFGQRVSSRDYDRFLHRMRALVKMKRVKTTDQTVKKQEVVIAEAVQNNVPIFGFQTGE